MTDIKDGAVGVMLTLIANTILIWQGLLIYTESTSRQLLGGGIFGLLVGLILGSTLPVRTDLTIISGVAGALSIAGFNQIVQGEVSFPLRWLVLYLLPLLIAACLSFLGAKVSEIVRAPRKRAAA